MAKVRVRYKGLSDRRVFSRKDLEKHGVAVDKDLEFSRTNNYAMNIDINDELTSIFKNEGTFTISEIKDDNTVGDDIVKATIADDTATAAKVTNTNTGQTQENPKAGKQA
jgi:hypothetical protein